MRARPSHTPGLTLPFLKLPGSNRLRTLPDGLWLHFGGTAADCYVDIFAIEACGSLSNLLDKRSRFAPSTHSLMAVCPVGWLMDAPDGADEPRWRAIGALTDPPIQPLTLPVRDIRVMYALKKQHFSGFTDSQVPHPHEYFVPMDALVAEGSDENPAMQRLVGRADARANFFADT